MPNLTELAKKFIAAEDKLEAATSSRQKILSEILETQEMDKPVDKLLAKLAACRTDMAALKQGLPEIREQMRQAVLSEYDGAGRRLKDAKKAMAEQEAMLRKEVSRAKKIIINASKLLPDISVDLRGPQPRNRFTEEALPGCIKSYQNARSAYQAATQSSQIGRDPSFIRSKIQREINRCRRGE